MNKAQRFVYWLDNWTHLFRYSQRKRADWFASKFPLQRLLEGTERVLDIGCGTGAITSLLASHPNRRVVGLDVTNYLTLEYRSEAPFEYITADAHKLPFSNGSFNCVTIFWVLHHVDNPGQVISEAMRVLADGGKLIIVEDILSRQTRFERFLVHLYDSILNLEIRREMHENRSLDGWKNMLSAVGRVGNVEVKFFSSYCCLPFLKFGLLVATKV